MEISFKKPVIRSDAYAGNLNIGSAKTRSARSKPAAIREDEVVLSSEAGMLKDIRNIFNSIPDVREEMVEEIREQIADGSYRISGKEVAGKLVRESLLNALT